MKTIRYAKLTILAAALVAISCKSASTKNDNADVDNTTTNAPIEKEKAASETNNEQPVDVLKILPEMGELNTKAEANDFVLIPDYAELERYAKSDGSEYIKYNKATMIKPGETSSLVKFTFAGEKEVPNHLILHLPNNEKVKKGDIVNTWWQSGSGMNRAIVIDDANPSEPVVNYIDIDWNNKVEKNGKTIGQLEEQLQAKSFVKLTSDFQPGTTVAYKENGGYKKGIVVNEKNDRLLVLGFMGKPVIINKSDSRAIPIKPKLKVGQSVLAPRSYVYKDAVVEKIDEKYGRVHLKFKDKTETDVLPFGDVIAELNF